MALGLPYYTKPSVKSIRHCWFVLIKSMFLFGLPHSWGKKNRGLLSTTDLFRQVWQEGPFSGALCFARANEVLLSVGNKDRPDYLNCSWFHGNFMGLILAWLVLWNMTGLFFHILGMSSSQLTNSMIFQRGRAQPPTSSFISHRIHVCYIW